jgi:hypothetical protein
MRDEFPGFSALSAVSAVKTNSHGYGTVDAGRRFRHSGGGVITLTFAGA